MNCKVFQNECLMQRKQSVYHIYSPLFKIWIKSSNPPKTEFNPEVHDMFTKSQSFTHGEPYTGEKNSQIR